MQLQLTGYVCNRPFRKPDRANKQHYINIHPKVNYIKNKKQNRNYYYKISRLKKKKE